MAARYTFGAMPYPDYALPPECLIIWGRNSIQTGGDGASAQLKPVLDGTGEIIVVDPRKTPPVSKSTLWLKPKPGSDGLLALGMLHVIITDKLYDEAFVDRWTIGFNRLTHFITAYPPDVVARQTWVPRDLIAKAARVFANAKSAAIQWGNALDQTNNAFQACRAVAIMMAITGNLDAPGGALFPDEVPLCRGADFSQVRDVDPGRKDPVGSRFKLATEAGLVPSQEISKAILRQKPYPLKAGLVFGSNPLLTYAGARTTFEALQKLDFLVVADLFMTPSAAMADVLLPVAANLEYDDIVRYRGCVAARPQIKAPPGECRSDMQWMNLIAGRMGFGRHFWSNESAALDAVLAPAGLNYDQLQDRGIYCVDQAYRKYEQAGFATPSGKVELFSARLQAMDIDPLPVFTETVTSSRVASEASTDYPLVLTSSKNPFFYHASHRNIPSLRNRSPEPIVELHPETAAGLDLEDGDRVCIESPAGKIRQKLRLNADLDPRVAVVAFGWWFPEKGPDSLYGWQEANLNLLTDDGANLDPAMGSASLRGVPCKVCRGEDNSY
jgi:anaerobic selenocysteine-containing dehydrogenase